MPERLKSEKGEAGRVTPEPGDEVVLRASDERARVLAVLDAAGTLLVAIEEEPPFQVAADEWERPWARHASCGCC